jgi:hypothetical protein
MFSPLSIKRRQDRPIPPASTTDHVDGGRHNRPLIAEIRAARRLDRLDDFGHNWPRMAFMQKALRPSHMKADKNFATGKSLSQA